MPEQFKSAGLKLTDEWQTIYEVGDTTTALVLLAQVTSMVDTGDDALVDVMWVDEAEDEFHLTYHLPVPPRSAIGVIDGRLAMPANTHLRMRADRNDAAEAVVSALETL